MPAAPIVAGSPARRRLIASPGRMRYVLCSVYSVWVGGRRGRMGGEQEEWMEMADCTTLCQEMAHSILAHPTPIVGAASGFRLLQIRGSRW